jgi:seryl-tRNA synthetase
MHDIRAIRADPAAFGAALTRRGVASSTVAAITELDQAVRALQTELQSQLAIRN